jgi:hypothetical protein
LKDAGYVQSVVVSVPRVHVPAPIVKSGEFEVVAVGVSLGWK